MRGDQKISAGGILVLLLVLVNIVILEKGLTSRPRCYQLGFITLPLLLGVIAVLKFRRKK